MDCTGLKGKINLPSTVETIDLGAFGGCSGLTGTLTLPHGVRVLRSAFRGCSGLTEVNIPGDVEFLGDYIFNEAINIKTIYFDGTEDQWDNLTGWYLSVFGYIPGFNCYGKDFCWGMWEDNRYWACKDGTLSIDFVNGAEGAIPGYSTSNPAPWSSYQFQNLTFHGQVTGIGNYAFYGCNGLTSVDLPDSITYIGNGAFQNCQGLTIVELGTGVASIGEKAFADCSQLTDFRVYAGNQNFCSAYGILYNADMSKLVCVPGGLSGSFDVPYGVTTIDKYAFSGCTGLTSVGIPVDVTSIGNSAFSGCTGLTVVYYTGSATQWKAIKMGTSNTPLTNAKILYDYLIPIVQGPCGENLKWMLTEGGALHITGEGAIPDFSPENPAPWSSYQFSSLVIEGYVTRIGNYAFQNHSELANVDFTNRVKSIGTNAFAGCTTLAKVEYSGSPEEQRVIAIAEGNEPLVNANWICRTVWITGAQDLGKGLTSGQSTQLTARMMPEGTVVTPKKWVLPEEYRPYATLSSSGVITAKDVSEKVRITVWAEAGNGWAGMSFYILPRVASLTIDQGSALTVDMDESATLNLTATTIPEDASNKVTWSTSDKKIATVDGNGLITLLKPGTVTIKATSTDGSKKFASMKLTVYYLDKAKKLTAKAEVPAIGLQPGQTATVTVSGSSQLEQSKLYFSIPASQQNIATVDECTGVVTAGTTPGTATVTATLRDDPLERAATVDVKVVAMQAEALELSADVDEAAQVKENTVILDAKNVSNSLYTFTVSAQAMDYASNWVDTRNVTWVSGNNAIATVKANTDGTATVTVKKGASGECAITATAKDLGKVSAQLWLSVRDYAPRLETSSPAMNLYQSSSVDVALMESYGNTIDSVSVDDNFDAAWKTGVLTLTARDGVKKGTYTQTLNVTCANGETYAYTLKIKVTETEPTVTIKQSGKYNLFYTDGAAVFTVDAKGAAVADVCVIAGDFSGAFADGVLHLTCDGIANPSKKITLEIKVEGWEKKVEKTVTLATVTTAPKLKLSTASSIINTNYDKKFTSFQVLSGTGVLPFAERDVSYSGNFADFTMDADTITLTLNGTKGGTAILNIQKANWVKPVKLTHKVTVQTAMPTLKLGATTFKLNNVFPELGTETTVSLSQGNLTLSDVEITAKTAGSENLEVAYENGRITAKIKDGKTVKAGTYTYTCTGVVDGITLKAVTLKVTVSATNPKVKLDATTFKLNRYLAGQESISTKVTVPAGYTLNGFTGTEGTPLSYADGYLTACLEEGNVGGTYILYPIVTPDGGSEAVTLSTKITVKVNTYKNMVVSATVTTKGKLDTLNPNSAITCTVKLKNCAGSISGISLSGQDGDLFHAETNESGNVLLTLKEGVDYATNKTYRVTLEMVACGKNVSANISFKVTQSALKVTASPATVTCYQATGSVTTTLTITSPATAQIADVALDSKTTAAFRKALGEDGLHFDAETGKLTLTLQTPGLLTPGKSYTVYLNVTPQGNAENVKPTQVKLTVKVKS